jgi:hypothetical protein
LLEARTRSKSKGKRVSFKKNFGLQYGAVTARISTLYFKMTSQVFKSYSWLKDLKESSDTGLQTTVVGAARLE